MSLDTWMERLVRAWRERRAARGKRAAPGPHGALAPDELKAVAAGVKRLSLGLTRDRHLAGARYMDDPELLGAYLLFYWPVSYAQATAALGELGRRPRTVLDVGSGPGPMAFAALDLGAREVTAVDRSRPALELARTLAGLASESLSTREWTPGQPLPEGRFDTITAGHVLNELFGGDVSRRAELVEALCARLAPDGAVVVVEPALKDTSRALLEVRDVLVARGLSVRAPCLFRGPCPALARPTDWCHADRPWTRPPLVEAIARAAGLHKESLKLSYLVVSAPGAAWPELPAGRLFRIVSEPLEGKGRDRYMGCGPEGRVGLALQHRHRTEANAVFSTLARGDVIRVEGTEARGDGLALTESSTVERVARAGWAFPPRTGGS